jgi:type I restriction enzyme, S subunit
MMNKMWQEYKLGAIVDVGRGSSPRPITDEKYFIDGNIPWIKIADATVSGKYILSTREYVNEYGSSFSRLLNKDDLIISASGSIGVIKFLGVKGCIHDGWLYLSNYDEKLIDKFFLYYKLLTLKEGFDNYSYGAAIQNINTEILRELKINLPPLPIQRRIASILGNYDLLIANYEAQISTLEESAREIYTEWFVRGRCPYGNMEEWEKVKISDLYNTSSGGTPSREKEDEYYNGNINWVKTGELEDSFIFETGEKITYEGLKNSSTKIFPPKTVIIGMYGATVGKLGILAAEATTNQACCALLLKNDKYSFAYIFLHLEAYRHHLVQLSMGAAQQNISQDEIKNYFIYKPTDLVIEHFNKIQLPIFQKIENLQRQIEVLKSTRDKLLPRLLSGVLAV